MKPANKTRLSVGIGLIAPPVGFLVFYATAQLPSVFGNALLNGFADALLVAYFAIEGTAFMLGAGAWRSDGGKFGVVLSSFGLLGGLILLLAINIMRGIKC